MAIKDDTQDLNESFDDMSGKMRSLTDDMKVLSSDGMEKLSKVINQSITAGRQAVTRQPAESIITSELSKLLKQEVMSGLGGLFGNRNKTTGGILQGGGLNGSDINVVVNNNTPFSVTARETGGDFNQKTLEIMIDQMVADSLMRGRQTSSVMRGIFGLAPSLIGR